MVYGFSLSIDDVKNYLDYENSFWNYVEDKIKFIKNPYIDFDLKVLYYGVWYDLDENKNLKRLVICIPEIVDLKTAQIAIHEFRHAHDIFTGNIKNNSELEEIARHEEDRFKNEYLAKKLSK